MKRVAVAALVLLVGLAAALSWKIRAQQASELGPPSGSGTIEAPAIDLASRTGGRLLRVMTREGATVQEGDALAELDCREPQARLAEIDARIAVAEAQAEAAGAQTRMAGRSRAAASAAALAARAQADAVETQREAATTERARVEVMGSAASGRLRDQAASSVAGATAQVEAARAQTRATSAQAAAAAAQVDAASAQARAAERSIGALHALREVALVAVGECVVRAPRGGRVDELLFEVGELVSPGAAIVRIVALEEVTAVFYLPNAELAEARPGRRARVEADAWPDEGFDAVVTTVAVEAEFTPRQVQTRTDRDRLVYAVEVRIPNPDGRLRPGMPVQVTLVEGDEALPPPAPSESDEALPAPAPSEGAPSGEATP